MAVQRPESPVQYATFGGERLVLDDPAYDREKVEHVHRYRFATKFAAGARVLDVGCGSGYGAAILSETAADVLGIDQSLEAIIYCKQMFDHINLVFQHCNIYDLKNTFPPSDLI